MAKLDKRRNGLLQLKVSPMTRLGSGSDKWLYGTGLILIGWLFLIAANSKTSYTPKFTTMSGMRISPHPQPRKGERSGGEHRENHRRSLGCSSRELLHLLHLSYEILVSRVGCIAFALFGCYALWLLRLSSLRSHDTICTICLWKMVKRATHIGNSFWRTFPTLSALCQNCTGQSYVELCRCRCRRGTSRSMVEGKS